MCATYYKPFDNAPHREPPKFTSTKCPAANTPICKEQAESMGLGARWHEIARTYAEVNMAFGDIVKVTPSSKVVGDFAIFW